jgi:hypothetical protein
MVILYIILYILNRYVPPKKAVIDLFKVLNAINELFSINKKWLVPT